MFICSKMKNYCVLQGARSIYIYMELAKNVFLMGFTSADYTSEMIISYNYTVSDQNQRKFSVFTNA